jgi:hypothetical protein
MKRAVDLSNSSRKDPVPAGRVAWYTVDPSFTALVLMGELLLPLVLVHESRSGTPPLTTAPGSSLEVVAVAVVEDGANDAEVIVVPECSFERTIGALT